MYDQRDTITIFNNSFALLNFLTLNSVFMYTNYIFRGIHRYMHLIGNAVNGQTLKNKLSPKWKS